MDVASDAGKLYQIVAALVLAVGFFVVAYVASPRKTVALLICLSPFQTIDSPYTSSTVMLTYVVGIAYILRGRIKYVPMIGFFLVIIGIYLASMAAGAHRATYTQHGIYIFNYVSAVLLFYIVYNFVRETRDVNFLVWILIALNACILVYCVLQIVLGPNWSLFGIQELSLRGGRGEDDPRLTGPYAVGVTAEHLVLSILLLAFVSIYTESLNKRLLLYFLMAVNLGCLVATANRGGFLTLVGGAALFLIFFRSRLGVKRAITLSAAGTFLLVATSIVVVNYTQYGQMYERLQGTELEGGMPDSRAKTWSRIAPEIASKPLLGHGPRLRLYKDFERPYPGTKVMLYPHNLYLYLLYTVGIVGLLSYLWFFAWIAVRLRRGVKNPDTDQYAQGFVKLGLLSMIIFLVDEIKIEFLRIEYVDYWYYIFILFAIFLAVADLACRGAFSRNPMATTSTRSTIGNLVHVPAAKIREDAPFS